MIDRITIKGYKSIRSLESFELKRMNVLIGANGAGKSNFVSFFRLLKSLVGHRLQLAVGLEGGADACLFLGSKTTSELVATIASEEKWYAFGLVPTPVNTFVFSREECEAGDTLRGVGPGQQESGENIFEYWGVPSIGDSRVYHFNDTSSLALVRRPHAINDNEYLREDASNLGAYLYRLRATHHSHFALIRDLVRMAAPFFEDFNLRPIPSTPDLVQLEWLQKDSDYPFGVHQMSDGTLRFVCLATALLQPSRPATMFFDEPELGLHPHALSLLGALFQKASRESQIIVSTQSADLLNEFEAEDVVVVERSHGESVFRRLDPASLSEWLEEYSLGELWQKNVLGGSPKQDRFPSPVAQP